MRQDGARAGQRARRRGIRAPGICSPKIRWFSLGHQNEARVAEWPLSRNEFVHMRHFAPLKGERLQRARRLGLQVVQRPRGPKAPR